MIEYIFEENMSGGSGKNNGIADSSMLLSANASRMFSERYDGGMPVPQFGDIYFKRVLKDTNEINVENDAEYISRPAIIWGIYWNKNKVEAVDVILPTSNTARLNLPSASYSSDLFYDQNEVHLVGTKKPGKIMLFSVVTMPWLSTEQDGSFFQRRGPVAKINPSIYPHMIVRRDHAIRYYHSEYLSEVALDPEWTREGLFLPKATPVFSGAEPPEVDCRYREREGLIKGLDKELVLSLIEWSESYRGTQFEKGKYITYPAASIPHTNWPGWNGMRNVHSKADRSHEREICALLRYEK